MRGCAQVCILDGNKYTSRCREMGEQRLDILDECEVGVGHWRLIKRPPLPHRPHVHAKGRHFASCIRAWLAMLQSCPALAI